MHALHVQGASVNRTAGTCMWASAYVQALINTKETSFLIVLKRLCFFLSGLADTITIGLSAKRLLIYYCNYISTCHCMYIFVSYSQHFRCMHALCDPQKGGNSRTERKYHSTRLADKIEITVRYISYRVSNE